MSVCVRYPICVNIQVIVSEYERECARKMVFQERTCRTSCVPLVKVAQSCLTLGPHRLYSPWNSPGQNTGVEPFPSPGDLPNPGIEPRSCTLQADSLPAESQGKPKNTGVGSLSLLQWIFLTQELNRGLLHCRQILYHLSYQGSPFTLGQKGFVAMATG